MKRVLDALSRNPVAGACLGAFVTVLVTQLVLVYISLTTLSQVKAAEVGKLIFVKESALPMMLVALALLPLPFACVGAVRAAVRLGKAREAAHSLTTFVGAVCGVIFAVYVCNAVTWLYAKPTVDDLAKMVGAELDDELLGKFAVDVKFSPWLVIYVFENETVEKLRVVVEKTGHPECLLYCPDLSEKCLRKCSLAFDWCEELLEKVIGFWPPWWGPSIHDIRTCVEQVMTTCGFDKDCVIASLGR